MTEEDLDLAYSRVDNPANVDSVIGQLLAAADDPSLRSPELELGVLLVYLSEIQTKVGRLDDAEATLRRAIADDLHDGTDSATWLVNLFVGQGRLAEARQVFDQLVARGGAGMYEYERYAEALESAGEHVAAVEAYIGAQRAAEAVNDTHMADSMEKSATNVRKRTS